MKMDDETSIGRSAEFSEGRARSINAAIDDTAQAYSLGSTVARAHILSDFIREGAARLAETLATRPELFTDDGGWALSAARRARADLAAALDAFDAMLTPHAQEGTPSWEKAEAEEVRKRRDAIELDRELLEILGLAAYADRYVQANDDYRAHLLQQAVGDIVREFAGVYFKASDWERVRLNMVARVNRAPAPRPLPSAPVASADDGYDDDGYDD